MERSAEDMDDVQTDRFDDRMPNWTRKKSEPVRYTRCPTSEGKCRSKKNLRPDKSDRTVSDISVAHG